MLTRRDFMQLVAATPLVRYLPHGDALISTTDNAVASKDVYDADILNKCVFLDGTPIRVLDKYLEIESDYCVMPPSSDSKFVTYQRVSPIAHYVLTVYTHDDTMFLYEKNGNISVQYPLGDGEFLNLTGYITNYGAIIDATECKNRITIKGNFAYESELPKGRAFRTVHHSRA